MSNLTWIVINCEFLFQTNLTSLEGLSKFIDPSQLTPDLEGGLSYEHGIWIELRCVSKQFAAILLRQTEKLYTFYFPPENVTRILLFSRLLSQPCLMGILKQQLCNQLTCWGLVLSNKSKNLGHHVAGTRWEKSHFVSSAATRVWALAIFWLDLSSLGLGSTNDDKSLSEILSAV